MREKLLPILRLLLLWLLSASVYDSDAPLGTLRTEAVEWSNATYLENAGHGDNISSSSQKPMPAFILRSAARIRDRK